MAWPWQTPQIPTSTGYWPAVTIDCPCGRKLTSPTWPTAEDPMRWVRTDALLHRPGLRRGESVHATRSVWATD